MFLGLIMIKDIIVTPLNVIDTLGGDVMHVMKKSSAGYVDFGEAYFSTIGRNRIKGWKKHEQMVLNIAVPVGEIKFVIYNENSQDFFSISLSKNNYKRLTISPGLWIAFKGMQENNMLVNIANIEHDPNESENVDLNTIDYEW